MNKLTEGTNEYKRRKLDKNINMLKDFKHLWKMVEERIGDPYYIWTEWRQKGETFGNLASGIQSPNMVLKESLVKYCDFKSDELYDISNVGLYDTDYPIIFFANIVNGEIIGNWVQPHAFYDYWSFRDSIIIDTGSIPNVMPLVWCSIGLPKVFEQNGDNDSLHANLWLYSRDLFEEEAEDMEDASLYAEGGIG
tara:strand:+ start:2784 stop:3365 length:582 start_codon:yes stop_codon:yes gene_type:complete